ncbi:MAG: LamG domain-containing protein, partial [Polyangiaceae bacterium]
MRSAFNGRVVQRFSALWLLGIVGLPLACGADDQFAPQTDDEYKSPLTNAIIGTPTGVIEISADGRTTINALGKAGASAGGAAGAGGSTIAGGAAGKVGSGGAVGSFAGKGATGPTGGTGSTGSTGPAGPGGSGGNGSGGGFGQWHFDDCSPKSHFLLDSSGFGANAQQALKANCVAGISGLGVQLKDASDVVQVADQPQFSVSEHVGVAAWVNPKNVSGDQPIVIKRLNNKTAFSLGIHNGNIEMSVVLKNGTTVISRAPIAAKKWTHVAGLFDGTFVFLFINGQQFGQVYGAGKVRDVFAPIRIGATTETQFFNGTIDEVFLTTQTITPDVLTGLACIPHPSTLAVNPASSGPVQPDTNVHYDITLTNNDVGACQSKFYQAFVSQTDPGITANFQPQFAEALPGAQAKLGLDVTGTEDADPGVHTVRFSAGNFNSFPFEQLDGQVDYELIAPTGCFVSTRRELMITHTSVVDDPIRTAGSVDPTSGGVGGAGGTGGTGGSGEAGAPNFPPPPKGTGGVTGGVAGSPSGTGTATGKAGSTGTAAGGTSSGSASGTSTGPAVAGASSGPSAGGAATGTAGSTGTGVGGGTGTGPVGTGLPAGVWSFGHLMREMAPTPASAPAFTLKLLQHWLTNQTVNGFIVEARPRMQQMLIDIWPKTANGELDLDQSPLTLQAIVNRIDVRNLAEGSAGEGRFVFGVNGGNFANFTVIVEYNLVGHTQQDVSNWANRWHALGSLPFPSETYNAALEAVTRGFTDRNASPGSANGSALVELRTNEIALSNDGRWQLRSFALSPTTGQLDEVTVKETPDLGFNNTSTFASFVNQNAEAIIGEVPGGDSHTVPSTFDGKAFLGGAVFNDQVEWNGPGITNPDARFHASLNTCNGCHSPQTGTFNFLMINPRKPPGEAFLSPFLTGTTVPDLVTGQPRVM